MSLYGKVENVELVEHIAQKLDLMKIAIDFDVVYAFGDYNEYIEFLGKEVQYDTRQDVYKGQIITVVASIINKYIVQTINKTEDIKLLTGNTERPVCNFAIGDLPFGDVVYGAICFFSSYTVGKSVKARWFDCTMVDKNGKVFILKIFADRTNGEFTTEELLDAKIGHYVTFDISLTKYGYQTEMINLVDIEVGVAPEVLAAEEILNNAIAKDSVIQNYVSMCDLMNIIKKTMRIELGAEFIYMAAELSLIQSLENISDVYDFQAMRRAVFATRGYLLPHNTEFSKAVLNVTKAARTDMKLDKEVLLMLDPVAEEPASKTKECYYRLCKLAEDTINERRGINEEIEETSSSRNAIELLNNVLSRLF